MPVSGYKSCSYPQCPTDRYAIKNWEGEAHKAWFTGNGARIQESPRNFQAGFVGTWANNRSLLLTETESGTIYRIIQSGLTAWWLVMARCVAAGLDAGIAREWLDRAERRHYADTLVDAVLGTEVGPFEFQAKSLQQAFDTDPRVDPVLCMTGDPDSASAHADRMIGNVIDDLKNRPRTPETPQQVH